MLVTPVPLCRVRLKYRPLTLLIPTGRRRKRSIRRQILLTGRIIIQVSGKICDVRHNIQHFNDEMITTGSCGGSTVFGVGNTVLGPRETGLVQRHGLGDDDRFRKRGPRNQVGKLRGIRISVCPTEGNSDDPACKECTASNLVRCGEQRRR